MGKVRESVEVGEVNPTQAWHRRLLRDPDRRHPKREKKGVQERRER